MSARARPRAPGMWPAFRERVVLEGRPFRVAAWRVGRDAAILWSAFGWNSARHAWERAS